MNPQNNWNNQPYPDNFNLPYGDIPTRPNGPNSPYGNRPNPDSFGFPDFPLNRPGGPGPGNGYNRWNINFSKYFLKRKRCLTRPTCRNTKNILFWNFYPENLQTCQDFSMMEK